MQRMLLVAVVAALLVVAARAAAAESQLFLVDLRQASQADTLAAQSCIGLINRIVLPAAPAAYSLMGAGTHDEQWLDVLHLRNQTASTNLDDLLQWCFIGPADAPNPIATGYIRFNASSQKKYVPLLLTLAGVLGAVPLDVASPAYTRFSGKTPMVLDSIAFFAAQSLADATRQVFDLYGNATTTTAMMNPGFAINGWNDGDPPLTEEPNLGLADYIVKQKLFNFYLVNGCINGTNDSSVMQHMVSSSQTGGFWPRLIPNFGYNDAWQIFGGDIFEAMTNCVPQRNMGECASSGYNNLAFLSRTPTITAPLPVNSEAKVVYNASKTYMMFIMGDGDNTQFLKTGRFDMMNQRQSLCKAQPSTCFPLMWSYSSWMLSLAPKVVDWYYAAAQESGQDYFMFPPSGYLYSYPSMFPEDVQEDAVRGLEARAAVMNTFTTVSWEPFTQWTAALRDFYPKYADRGVITGVFAVNVPFLIPVLEFGLHYYLILNSTVNASSNVVVFRPREWRGSDTAGIPPFSQPEYFTPQQMADEINGYAKGTVSHLYCTTDGGFNLPMLFDLVSLLAAHVEVVTANQLVDLARQRSNSLV